MNNLRILLSSFIVQIKQTFSRSMFRFCVLISPVINTVLLGEMYKMSSSSNFTGYVILGAGLMSLWECICFSSASDINRERFSNTLSLIFVSPSDFRIILLGKVFGNTVLSLLSFVLTIFFSFVLYNQIVSIANISAFLLSFSMVILSFITFSIFVAYILTLSRKTEVLMNCLDIPLTLICGFVFPIDHLPEIIQHFSMVFPMTWSVKMLRQSIEYSELSVNFFKCFMLSGSTIILFAILSNMIYKVVLKQIRIKATLELA